MDGGHPDSHYLDDTHVVYDELEADFNVENDSVANVYLTVVDISTDAIESDVWWYRKQAGKTGWTGVGSCRI